MIALLCVSGIVWRARNSIAFNNSKLNVQRWKYSLVTHLWSWVKEADPERLSSSLHGFIGWLGPHLVQGVFLYGRG